jgi:hypothetical protein
MTTSNAAERAFRLALRDLVVFLLALAVLGALVGWLVAGLPGVWSALMGAALVLVFSGTTVVSMLRTADAGPTAFAGTVAGLWLAKFVVVIVVVLVLRGMDFYDKPVFGITVALGALGAIALDIRAVRRARVPYVEPAQGPESAPAADAASREGGLGPEDPSA